MPPRKPKKADVRNKQSTSEIKRISVEVSKGISFSFIYLQNDNQKFSVNNRDARYFESLLIRLKALSTLTFPELKYKKYVTCVISPS